VKFLVESLHISLALLLCTLLTTGFRSLGLALLVMLGETYICVEFGNLVSVLAGSWNLNWTSPIEVEMTESKC